MNCHMCGRREGTIHLLELINGRQKSLWLCPICASGRSDLPAGKGPERLLGAGGDGEPLSLASFLGRLAETEGEVRPVADCPSCGYSLAAFQSSSRLGCASCYDHFRAQLLPILNRYHRHATHLGRVPRRASGIASRQSDLMRLKVALEKAIRAEDYEEAAVLRDRLRALTAVRDADRDGAGGPGEQR